MIRLSCNNFNCSQHVTNSTGSNWFNESNQIKVGKSDSISYLSFTKIFFKIEELSEFYNSERLIVKVCAKGENLEHLTAFVDSKDLINLEQVLEGSNKSLATSLLYSDLNKNQELTCSETYQDFYFIFETSRLCPEEEYYLYIIPQNGEFEVSFEGEAKEIVLEYIPVLEWSKVRTTTGGSTTGGSTTGKPVINPFSIQIQHTYIESMTGDKNSLVKNSKITFKMSSGTTDSANLFVRYSINNTVWGPMTVIDPDMYEYNKITNTITVSPYQVSYIPDGCYFQYAFCVTSQGLTSSITDWIQPAGRKPVLSQLPVLNNFETDAKYNNAEEGYFKNYIKITYTNSEENEARPKVTSLALVASYGGVDRKYVCSTAPGQQIETINLSQVGEGLTVKFWFEVTDLSELTLAPSDAMFSCIKASNPVFSGNLIDISMSVLKPYSNTLDFIFSHPIALAKGSSEVRYSYEIGYLNEYYAIMNHNISQIDSSTQKVSILSDNINGLMIDHVFRSYNRNSSYTVTLVIAARDGFGTETKLYKNFTVNFIEAPYFEQNASFKIRHEFATDSLTEGGVEVPETTPSNWESNRDKVMVNSNETIIFVFPEIKDYNEDQSSYLVYMYKEEFADPSKVKSIDEVDFGSSPWLTIPISQCTTMSNGLILYPLKAPSYSVNEYYYFKIRGQDSYGNLTKEIKCPSYIVGCRTVQPSFSVTDLKVVRNDDRVTLTYNLNITDLGGSATSKGWDRKYYELCPNFERKIDNYNPKVLLSVAIAPTADFNSEETLFARDIIGPNTGWMMDFKDSGGFTIDGFSSEYNKIFIKFIISVPYSWKSSSGGSYAIVESFPVVRTYFGNIPTVSHRSHHVGINTTSFEDDEVLVVANYSERNIIALRGIDSSTAESRVIEIDLSNGSINGAIIDGGTW